MNIYQVHWEREPSKTLLGYLRDMIIASLPLRRLPKILRVALLGVDPKFVFLVHPRRKKDVHIAWPFAGPFRVLLRKHFYFWIQHLPPTVLDVVKTPQGVDGVIISSTWLPDALIRDRKKALKEARKCLRFAARLSRKNAYLGLGEWWPFLTKRGEAVQDYARKLGMQVTSGYSGTLCSLLLSVKQIAESSGVDLSQLKVLIIGVGKTGSSAARLLSDHVKIITIFDRNRAKQDRLAYELNSDSRKAVTISLDNKKLLKLALSEHDICICTTSNLRRILTPGELPDGVLMLDDSRPEALPRIYDRRRNILVLEGGLLKINGVKLNYDFGFGKDGDVFGCLGEAYILACDGGGELIPTIGDVNFDNLQRMLSIQKRFGVEAANFRSSHTLVDTSDIALIIREKHGLCTKNKRASVSDMKDTVST